MWLSNLTLVCILVRNLSEQMQRELHRMALEFGDEGNRHFGITSWSLIEELYFGDFIVVGTLKTGFELV